MKPLPKLEDLFPFEYAGGGYFRRKGVPKNVSAEIIHGQEAIKRVYEWMKRYVETSNP